MSWGLISEMGYIGIRTPDVEAAIWDAENLLGLKKTGQTGDSVFLSAAGVYHELIYTMTMPTRSIDWGWPRTSSTGRD